MPGEDATLPPGSATPSHGTSSGVKPNQRLPVSPKKHRDAENAKDRRYKCTLQFLQRIQECDQVGHFFLRQIHLETLVVKIQQLGEVLRGAVVKIRGAGGEASQDGTFDAVHVAAEAGDEAFAGIGGVDDVGRGGRRRGEWIRAAGDFVDGNVGEIELREGVGDERIGFVGGVVAGADIERERERMIADVGRVMTGGAGALERGDGDGAERGIVVEAADVGDGERAGVEERFAGGDFFAGRDAESLEGIVGRLQIRPRLEHGERGGIERATVGIFAERIVGAGVVGLLREVVSAALRAVGD